jgi:serine protease inhibitor
MTLIPYEVMAAMQAEVTSINCRTGTGWEAMAQVFIFGICRTRLCESNEMSNKMRAGQNSLQMAQQRQQHLAAHQQMVGVQCVRDI